MQVGIVRQHRNGRQMGLAGRGNGGIASNVRGLVGRVGWGERGDGGSKPDLGRKIVSRWGGYSREGNLLKGGCVAVGSENVGSAPI